MTEGRALDGGERDPAGLAGADAARGPGTALGRLGADVARMRVLSILAGGAVGALTRGGARARRFRPSRVVAMGDVRRESRRRLILAWSTTRLAERVAPTRYWRLLLGTGFCGALTTFSTFQVETLRLARDGYADVAAGYAAASVAAGMACAVAGTVLARRRRYG